MKCNHIKYRSGKETKGLAAKFDAAVENIIFGNDQIAALEGNRWNAVNPAIQK